MGDFSTSEVMKMFASRSFAAIFPFEKNGVYYLSFWQVSENGPLAQWIRRRPPELEIPGSSPGRINLNHYMSKGAGKLTFIFCE